jgi:hypothetical protein
MSNERKRKVAAGEENMTLLLINNVRLFEEQLIPYQCLSVNIFTTIYICVRGRWSCEIICTLNLPIAQLMIRLRISTVQSCGYHWANVI